MKKLKYIYIAFLAIALIASSCEEDKHGPLNGDAPAPGPVRDVQVKNISGAAEISYKIPDDEGLSYVKAVYEVNGKTREAKSSFHNTKLLVEGFGEAKEYEVTLYAVSKSEKESVPVRIKVNPLTPPIIDVRTSLEVIPTFGGINVSFENLNNGNITIQVLRKDAGGDWVVLDNYYTKNTRGNFSVRGQEVQEITFGVFVKDRWNNYSDTLTANYTPIFEEEIPKIGFRDFRFPSEPKEFSSGWVLSRMWDNNITGNGYHTPQNIPQPFNVTFDMGASAKLSRYKIWQRQGAAWIYGHGNPHTWELWGNNSSSPLTVSEGFDGWVLLGTYQMVKPSGGAPGNNSAEDLAVSVEGHEYDIDPTAPPVRYLRWRHIDNWGAIGGEIGFLHIAEISVYGKRE